MGAGQYTLNSFTVDAKKTISLKSEAVKEISYQMDTNVHGRKPGTDPSQQ